MQSRVPSARDSSISVTPAGWGSAGAAGTHEGYARLWSGESGDPATPPLRHGDGIWLWPGTPGGTLGGTAPGDGNVISGNNNGIRIFGNNNQIEGNLIGTDYTGTEPLGNGNGIVEADGGSDNRVGGAGPGAGRPAGWRGRRWRRR